MIVDGIAETIESSSRYLARPDKVTSYDDRQEWLAAVDHAGRIADHAARPTSSLKMEALWSMSKAC